MARAKAKRKTELTAAEAAALNAATPAAPIDAEALESAATAEEMKSKSYKNELVLIGPAGGRPTSVVRTPVTSYPNATRSLVDWSSSSATRPTRSGVHELGRQTHFA